MADRQNPGCATGSTLYRVELSLQLDPAGHLTRCSSRRVSTVQFARPPPDSSAFTMHVQSSEHSGDPGCGPLATSAKPPASPS